MSSSIPSTLEFKLKTLYDGDDHAREFFNAMSQKVRFSNETTAEKAENCTSLSYSDVLALFKRLDKIGAGDYLVGRRGAATRIVWKHSLKEMVEIARARGEKSARMGSGEKKGRSDASKLQPVDHSFILRENFKVALRLPVDLNASESERLSAWVKTLPFDKRG